MYLIPQNPTVYNRKWDLDHTEYQISAGAMPGLPSALPSVNPVVPIGRPAPAINLPPSKRPCRACQCARKPSLSGMGISPRGISVPPQRRLGRFNSQYRLGRLGQTPSSDPPPDADTYQVGCPFGPNSGGLPTNTQLVAKVDFPETNTTDLYYSYTALPGASLPSQKWVCTVQLNSDGSASLQSPVVTNNPAASAPSMDTSVATIFGLQQPGGSALTQSGSLLSWFSQNWAWVAAFGLGFVAVKEL